MKTNLFLLVKEEEISHILFPGMFCHGEHVVSWTFKGDETIIRTIGAGRIVKSNIFSICMCPAFYETLMTYKNIINNIDRNSLSCFERIKLIVRVDISKQQQILKQEQEILKQISGNTYTNISSEFHFNVEKYQTLSTLLLCL